MPRVPTYDNFQTRPGLPPQVEARVPNAPDVAGRQMAQMGQAVQGLGGEVVTAILYKDYPVIQGVILVLGVIAIVMNLLIDVILGIIDPRTLGAHRVR